MRLLITYLLLVWCNHVNGQCDKSIVGSWHVVAAFNGQVYFNLKTDSSFISSEIREMYPDTLSQNRMLSVAKELYGTTKFIFEKNGVFKMYLDTAFQFEGKYCFKSENNILQLTSKNSSGENITDYSSSRFDKGFLLISQKQDDGERVLDLVLEKRP